MGDSIEMSLFSMSTSSPIVKVEGLDLVILQITHGDFRPEPDPVRRDVFDIELPELRHSARQIVEPRPHEALPLQGGGVLGILSQIALGRRPSRSLSEG